MQISGSTYTTVQNSGDIIVNVGSGAITLKNAANIDFKIVWSSDNNGTGDGDDDEVVVMNAAGTAATITEYYEEETFDVADYGSKIKTIDGSAAAVDLEITGNKLANAIIGGDGDDTLIGGKGNDTLTGGAGNDVFVYASGDGKDVIADYAVGDKIRITSGKISKSTVSGSDVIFTIGSGTLTVKKGKNKNITITDASNNTTTKKIFQSGE